MAVIQAVEALESAPPQKSAHGAWRPRVLLVVNSEWYFLSHRLALAIALVRAGCQVTVAAPVERNLVSEITAHGIRFVPLSLDRGYRSLRSEIASFRQLVDLYQRERPDIVHQVTIKPVLYGSVAARWAGLGAVINAVPGLGYTFAGKGFLGALRRSAVKLAYRAALTGRTSRVIFQNPEDRDLFTTNHIVTADRAVLIRGSGVDATRFVPSELPAGDPVLLLASRMLWDKGVGELVAATRILRNSGVRFRTVLVGMPDEQNPRSIPEDVLQGWSGEGVVEWWGHRTDMVDVFRASSIVVLPSYHEGLPRVLLEGAAAGRPLVATDIPGCREIVSHGENGFLVPPRNPSALADVLLTLINDPALQRRMGTASRALVLDNFRDEHVIERTFEVYRALLPSFDRSRSAASGDMERQAVGQELASVELIR